MEQGYEKISEMEQFAYLAQQQVYEDKLDQYHEMLNRSGDLKTISDT